MIKSITVTNFLGEQLRCDIANPASSGLAITSITGLGPGSATINVNDYAAHDGASFSSARRPSRNIVISYTFMWGTESIETVRHRTYNFFPIKSQVMLQIETDTRVLDITGYVESNDPTIFSSSEGTDISIICPDPNFYSAGDSGIQTTVFSGIDPQFEFPFSNDSLTDNLLLMGDIENRTERLIRYSGDSDVGVTITIHAIDVCENITIYNTKTRDIMQIQTKMIAGDDLIICTERGSKYVYRLRDGIMTNLINSLTKESSWFRLVRGDNIFTYTAESGGSNLTFKMENRVAYEGV